MRNKTLGTLENCRFGSQYKLFSVNHCGEFIPWCWFTKLVALMFWYVNQLSMNCSQSDCAPGRCSLYHKAIRSIKASRCWNLYYIRISPYADVSVILPEWELFYVEMIKKNTAKKLTIKRFSVGTNHDPAVPLSCRRWHKVDILDLFETIWKYNCLV